MRTPHPFSLSLASVTLLAACAGTSPPPGAVSRVPPRAMSAPDASAKPEIALDPRGAKLVDALVKGNWAAAETMLAPSLQKELSTEKLATDWAATTARLGAFKEIATTRAWQNGASEGLVVTARYEGGLIDVKASYLKEDPERATALYFGSGDAAARAMSLLLPYVRGDAGPLYSHLDDKLKDAISPDELNATWKSAIDGYGEFRFLEDSKTHTTAEYDVVTFSAQFAKTRSNIVVVFHKGGDRIADFVLRAVTPPPDQAPPSYARPETYDEQPALVGKGDHALPATLTVPKGKGPFPAVVLVHGSGAGAGDRDETILAQRPFRDIALGLASRGIVVLRYEKRTYGNNLASLAAVLPHLTIKEEATDDALEAVRTLRASPFVDRKRVYIVGHSEGGMLAPLIAEGEPSVAGIVVLAGPARPAEDLLLEQMTKKLASQGAAGKAKLDELTKKIARVKSADLSPETPSSELPLDVPASYWLSLRGYDPVAHAAKLAKPILVLRGDQDEQVAHLDFTMWQDKLGKSRFATLAELPGLSHAFVDAPYDVPHHVSEAAVTKIADWILARR